MGKYYVVCCELGIFGEKVGIFAGDFNKPDDYGEVTDAAVKAAAEYLLHRKTDFYFSHDGIGYIMRVVRDEPEPDEPARKKGHINISNHIEYCSECGKSLGIGYTNYCGYCGAELEP